MSEGISVKKKLQCHHFLASLVKSQETDVYRLKSKNNSIVLLKWLFYRTETINKCIWLRMARMEMDSMQLETSGRFFSSFCSSPEIVSQLK